MATEEMSNLYWLAYLLTGDRERSLQTVMETLELEDAANPFFENWMLKWARKIFIAKVLRPAIREAELSTLRSRLHRLQAETKRSSDPVSYAATDKAALEGALLAIDLFPRRAL